MRAFTPYQKNSLQTLNYAGLLLALCLIILANVGQAASARGDWWMFHHDPQHTGRSSITGPSSLLQKWAFNTNGFPPNPAIGSDGTIYADSSDHKLYAINQDGTSKWAFTTEGSISSSPAIGEDGTIYVGSKDHHLYAITPDGTQKWSFDLGGLIYASPAIGDDGTIYIHRSGCFYAVNPDGTLKWKFSFPEGGYDESSSAIGKDGTIYLGTDEGVNAGSLYAFSPDGKLQWRHLFGDSIFSSPAIGSDGTIYVGSNDHKLYAINPNGIQLWAFTTGASIYSSPSIGSDGTIYVGSLDHKLYAINSNGTKLWAFPTGASIYSSQAIGADGTIYVGSDNIYAVNPTGTLKSIFTNGNDKGSPTIGANGILYVGSDDGKLYAIGAPNLSLTKTVSSSSPKPGDTVSYTLNYCNTGNTTATNLTLIDSLPTGITYVKGSVSKGGNFASTAITWTLGTLSAGASEQATFQATVNTNVAVGANIANTAGIFCTEVPTPVVSKAAIFNVSGFTISPAAGTNGAISPNNPQMVNYNGSVTFTATANAGYTVDVWQLDGVNAQTSGTSYSLKNITANHTVKVTFKLLTFTITPSADSNGTISPNTPQTVTYGGNITFTAAANTGYTTDTWYLDSNAAQVGGVQYAVNSVIANHAVKVTFKLLTFTITPVAGANGALSPNKPQTVSYNGSVTFTATANAGYTTDTWTLDGKMVQTGGAQYTLKSITAIHTVKVTFKPLNFTITPLAGSNGTISPNTPQSAPAGASLTFIATGNAGYTVDSWSLDGALVQTGGSAYALKNITADHTVTVAFKAVTLTVTPSAGTNGAISPNTLQTVTYGGSMTFTATANAGYTVDSWQLDGVTTQTGGMTYTLKNITINHTIRVTFKPLTYTFTLTAGPNGTITPNTPQQVSYGGTITCTAKPNAGYSVNNWVYDGSIIYVGGKASNGAYTGLTCSISNVTASHTLMVSFKTQTFTITPSAGANGVISPNTLQTLPYGGSVTFTATANAGYTVDSWSLDGAVVQTGGVKYLLTNVTANHTVKVTFKAYLYQPDLLIRTMSESVYTGGGVFNLDGNSQSKGQWVINGLTAIYCFRVQNAGNATDSFTITAPAGGSGWALAYFDMDTAAVITTAITGTGWKVTNMAPGAKKGFYVQVTPALTVTSGTDNTITVTAVSTADATKKDVVKALSKAGDVAIHLK